MPTAGKAVVLKWAMIAAVPRSTTLEKEAGKPFFQFTTIGDLHCVAGCTVGDFAGEWVVFLTGFTLAGSAL